ncbi:hypothetical protein OFN25_30425, partial [Escherichia coli]|nr:hypothetical protein [Escherichia coli]
MNILERGKNVTIYANIVRKEKTAPIRPKYIISSKITNIKLHVQYIIFFFFLTPLLFLSNKKREQISARYENDAR